MNVTITPKKLAGAITPPPSKSQAHRLIIAAALSDGFCHLSNVSLSEDIQATLRCMRTLDADASADGTVIRVEGISESNHKGSFLHEEYHAENRHRKATGLDRGVDRSRGAHWAPTQSGGKKGLSWAPGPSSPNAPRPASQARKSADTPEAEIKKVIGWLVGIFVLGSFFLQFLDILGNAGW